MAYANRKNEEDWTKLKFLFYKDEFPGYKSPYECPDCVEKYEINSHKENEHSFVLKNLGKIPIKFNQISIQNTGCEGFGFKVLNCHPFSLEVGEEIILWMTYKP